MVADIEREARQLAAANVEAAPETEAVYLFPAREEIRLIETDPTTIRSEEIRPYYFDSDPRSGLHFRSAVAIIRPDEVEILSPPRGWGTWADAVRLWPED